MATLTTKLTYRVKEASAATGLSERELYRLLASGEIHSFAQGRVRLIPLTALEEWIARRSDPSLKGS